MPRALYETTSKLSSATKCDVCFVADFLPIANCLKATDLLAPWQRPDTKRYQVVSPQICTDMDQCQGKSSWSPCGLPMAEAPQSAVCTCKQGIILTVLLKVELLHSVDVTELCNPSLDLGAPFPPGHVDLLDHLLLPVDPVQPVLKHSQAHRLQDIGVLQHDPVSTCGRQRLLYSSTRMNWKPIRNILDTAPTAVCYLTLPGQAPIKPRQPWAPQCKTDGFCRQMINFVFCFHQEASSHASNLFTVFKHHLELGAQPSGGYAVFYQYDGNWSFFSFFFLERLTALSWHTTGNKKINY